MAEVVTSPTAVEQDQQTGRLAHIFRPPSSQGATQTTAIDYFGSMPRKRQRAVSNEDGDWQQPWSTPQHGPKTDDSGILSTESLLGNDRYQLQGGFDTPGLLADSDWHGSADTNARTQIMEGSLQIQSTEPAFAGPLARERNGFARPQARDGSKDKATQSWTRFALTLPLSIAGSVFTFGGAMLKGFYAGGGEGYELGTASPPSLRRQQSSFEPGTPIPGAWHDSPPLTRDNTVTSNNNAARPPPNKRRLTDKDTWVMVGSPDLDTVTPPSPKRRISTAISPRLSRPSAGRAGSRRSILASSRRHSYLTSTGSPNSHKQHNGTLQVQSPSRQQSFHRQSSPQHRSEPVADPEKLRRKQAKQDRAADRTMNSMTKQMEDLIREGQAALGTKFVVEDDDDIDDEGFVDEV